MNFLGGCSEKTKFCALEVTEDSVPDVADVGLSEVAEVGRYWCQSSGSLGNGVVRNTDASSIGDSERLEIGKAGKKFLFAAGDNGRTNLVASVEVCRYGNDVCSYGFEEDEYDPWWLLRSLDNIANGAIFG